MKVNRGEQARLLKELKEESGIDCSKNAISKLVKAGDYRIHTTKGGNIKIPETVKALVDSGFGNHGKKIKDKLDAKNGKPAKEPGKAKPEIETIPATREEVEGDPLKETDDRQKIESYLAFQKYEKERIANEKSKKELIELKEIEGKLFDILRPIRDDLQMMAKKVGLLAHSAETGHKACQTIQDESDRILLSRIGGEYLFDDSLKKKIRSLLTT